MAAWDTIKGQLDDRSTGWSIGVFGALAEFHHYESPARRVDEWTLESALGALRVMPHAAARLLAYEGPVRDPRRWDQGLVLCLPAELARMEPHHTITELGPDEAAIEEANRSAILFDLGLGSPLCRFCIRVSDASQVSRLRALRGRRITDPAVMDEVRTWSPHRVMLSAAGRIEVYQSIGTHETPVGPHTHLLPKILRPRVAASAYIPVPAGYEAALMMYPAGQGFQKLLADFGDEVYVRAKARALSCLQGGLAAMPADLGSRLERLAWRIARRQSLQWGSTPP